MCDNLRPYALMHGLCQRSRRALGPAVRASLRKQWPQAQFHVWAPLLCVVGLVGIDRVMINGT